MYFYIHVYDSTGRLVYEVGTSVIEDYNGLERKLSLNLQSSVMNHSISFIIISEMLTCKKRTYIWTFCPCCMQIEFFTILV